MQNGLILETNTLIMALISPELFSSWHMSSIFLATLQIKIMPVKKKGKVHEYFSIHLNYCAICLGRQEFPSGYANNMLVMHYWCDSLVAEKLTDVWL